MILNDKYKFMFFAEPHTASRACSRMLEEVEGSESVGEHHMTHESGIERGFLPKSGYLRFSVIRDPRELIASRIAHYQNVFNDRMSGPTPEEIVERYVNAHCMRKTYFEHDYVDEKIRYDRLEPELYSLLERLGVENVPKLGRNPHETTKGRKHWSEYFTEEQNNRVLESIPEIQQFIKQPKDQEPPAL